MRSHIRINSRQYRILVRKKTSDGLIDDGAVVLTYYVDGQVVGSGGTSVYRNGLRARWFGNYY